MESAQILLAFLSGADFSDSYLQSHGGSAAFERLIPLVEHLHLCSRQ